MATLKNKPTIYQGFPLPLEQLSSDNLEKFVAAVIKKLNSTWKIINISPNARDSGFDITLKRADKKIVCIQCKRYNNSLDLNSVGLEFAKVGLKSKLEGSDVVEHYIISTDNFNEKVNSAKRQTSREEFINSAIKAANSGKDLKISLGEAKEKNIDIEKTIREYILNLEKLELWNKWVFESEIGSIWSSLTEIIEKYFKIDSILREYPRPNFDEIKYLNSCIDFNKNYIPLYSKLGRLPANLEDKTFESPSSRKEEIIQDSEEFDLIETSLLIQNKECLLIIGRGGAGKTTSLKMILSSMAKNRLDNTTSPLPIYIQAKNYRGNIDKLINQALNIQHGFWQSITQNYVLLCDGINEAPLDEQQLLFDDLTRLISSQNISLILTLRNSGMNHLCSFLPKTIIYDLLPLNGYQMVKIARDKFKGNIYSEFCYQLFSKINSVNNTIYSLPYGFEMCINIFNENGNIPSSQKNIIQRYLEERINRNKLNSNLRNKELFEIDNEFIFKLTGLLAYNLRILSKKQSFQKQN